MCVQCVVHVYHVPAPINGLCCPYRETEKMIFLGWRHGRFWLTSVPAHLEARSGKQAFIFIFVHHLAWAYSHQFRNTHCSPSEHHSRKLFHLCSSADTSLAFDYLYQRGRNHHNSGLRWVRDGSVNRAYLCRGGCLCHDSQRIRAGWSQGDKTIERREVRWWRGEQRGPGKSHVEPFGRGEKCSLNKQINKQTNK